MKDKKVNVELRRHRNRSFQMNDVPDFYSVACVPVPVSLWASGTATCEDDAEIY